MKRKIAAALSVALLLFFFLYDTLLTSKPPATPFDEGLTEAPAQFALNYFSWLKAKNWDAFKAATDPSLLGASNERIFAAMADMIPQTEPTAIHLVGSKWVKSTLKPERDEVTLEYLFPAKALLANVVMDRTGDSFVVTAAHITPLTQPLERYYEFHFLGQGPTHYVVFGGVVLLILLNAYALTQCIMVPDLRRRWLWIIFVLVGFGSIEFNWTDAVFTYNVLSVQGPVARVMQHAYQPFILRASIPLGTIIFLARLRGRRQRQRSVVDQFD